MESTRREVLKAAWVVPAILTLPVTASMARAGSEVCGDDDQSLPPDQRLTPCTGPLAKPPTALYWRADGREPWAS